MSTTVDPLEFIRGKLGGTTQCALAAELGISPTYLSDVIHGRKEPGAKICEALGLKRVVTYEKVRKR